MAMSPKFMEGPIPGMSLTGEPRGVPWENPPRFATVEEVVLFYKDRILDEDSELAITNALEQGASIEMLAEQLATSGVMNGYHTLDVAFLVNPVIRELLMFVADTAGVEYTVSFAEEQRKQRVPKELAQDVVAEVMAEEAETPQEDMTEPATPSRGLMAKPMQEAM